MTDRHSRTGGNPIVIVATLLLASCAIGPDYKRPDVDLPKDFGVAQSAAALPAKWWSVFNDPVLERFVDEALAANRNLRAAAERIEEARAQVTIARAAEFPDAGVQANASRRKQSALAAGLPPDVPLQSDTRRLVLTAAWEVDFWGKYRRATEAARAALAASEAGRDAIRASLVADVIRGYFELQAIDRRRDVALLTLETHRKALELQKVRYDAGAVSELELRQIEAERANAQALVPRLEQQRLSQEGALAVLLGRSPREVFLAQVERGAPATPAAVEVPAGLPSDLLLHRPDLRAAEAQLHAANAGIGVARAAYFPSISLTGYYGGESQALADLFKGPARTWSVGAGLLQPLFAGGQLRGGVSLAEARTREAAEQYQLAVANAFREVRDAIAVQTSARDVFVARETRATALTRALELSRLRYEHGAISLFEVIDTERQLLAARLDAIDAERDRRNAVVDLYIALGG
jgi:multidrug efflux system outer membrane protein